MESSKLPTFPLEEFPRRWMRFWLKSLGLSPEEISYQSHFIPTEMTFGSPLKNIFENLQERHHRLYNHWGQQNNTIDGVKQSKSDVKEWLKMSKAKRSKHKRSVAYKHILKHDLLTHLNDVYQANPNEPSKIDGFSYPDEWLAWSEESLVERELNAHHFGLHKGFEMTEEQLEDYLSNHLEEIHPNLKLMKRQFILPKGRIDLLAKDLKTNRIWVIELKVEKDTDVIWQKWYYVNEIKKRFPHHDITFV